MASSSVTSRPITATIASQKRICGRVINLSAATSVLTMEVYVMHERKGIMSQSYVKLNLALSRKI